MAAHLFVYTFVTRNRSQQSEQRSLIFEEQDPFGPPCLLQTASCSRNTCTVACHMAGGVDWAAATFLRAKIDQN